jgi:hypothetical protein
MGENGSSETSVYFYYTTGSHNLEAKLSQKIIQRKGGERKQELPGLRLCPRIYTERQNKSASNIKITFPRSET